MSDTERIKAEILAVENTADHFVFQKIVDDFVEYDIYYIEFSAKNTTKADSFYYASIDKDGNVRLYDDGVKAIEKLKDILVQRRSFWQRITDFSLLDVTAALIALMVTGSFVYLSISQQTLNKEFTGIFGIIVGYYFGKSMVIK